MSWFSSFFNPGNPAADEAKKQTAMLEAQQKKHDDAVRSGKSSIDSAFSQFDNPWFEHYGQSYMDAYNPGVDDQYGIAKDKMTAVLAGKDQLGGSVGNQAMANLAKTNDFAHADIADKAADATNAMRGKVDQTKSGLYTQNTQAADPYQMASEAQGAAGTIVAPQSYPTAQNYFGDAMGGLNTAVKANQQSMNPVNTSQWFAPLS